MKKILVNIVQGLQARFNLRSIGAVEELGLNDSVQPITNVDELLKNTKITYTTVAISGTGRYNIYICPAHKRLNIIGVHVKLKTGVYTFNNIYLEDVSENIETPIYIFTSATEAAIIFPQKIPMGAGDILKASIDAFTSGGDIDMHTLQEIEDVF